MIYEQIVSREPVRKGWSDDKKYRAVTSDGLVCLLRISPAQRIARRKATFSRLLEVAALDIPMPEPLEWGICPEGGYTIESWIDGTDAEAVIPTLPEERQYAYGLDAGRILQKIHSLPAPADAEDWAVRFHKKIDRKLAMYADCPLKYDEGEAFIRHIERSRHWLRNRPQTYQHGDYHIGNMMIRTDGTLAIIDFDKDDFGDPFEEFNRIVWSAQAAPAFASGMVDGYFGGPVPTQFWELLALYICSNTLGSLPWAIPFGEGEIQTMRNQAKEVLRWYDGMSTCIPDWYQPR